MALPLMPKATAVWLVENTALTFEQIAKFCGLHSLEIQAIADGEVALGMVGLDPVANGQLTLAEIRRCETDPDAALRLLEQNLPQPVVRAKGPRYTPVTKRGDKPDAIAWLLKFHPDLSDAQICQLIGTTKNTIIAVRDRTHWNTTNIKPRSPLQLGLCSLREMEEALSRARKRTGNAAETPLYGDPASGDLDQESGDLDQESGDLDQESGDLDPASGDLDQESGDLDQESGDLDQESGDLDQGDADELATPFPDRAPAPAPCPERQETDPERQETDPERQETDPDADPSDPDQDPEEESDAAPSAVRVADKAEDDKSTYPG